MQLRWAASAEADLERIADYLSQHTPLHADRLIWSIYRAPEILLRSPLIGREGRRPATRELVLAPMPWIVIYVVRNDTIDVVRVLHGAQRWP